MIMLFTKYKNQWNTIIHIYILKNGIGTKMADFYLILLEVHTYKVIVGNLNNIYKLQIFKINST